MLVDREVSIGEIALDEGELWKVLTLLRSIKELSDSEKGSVVVSVNGDWGTGKTSYLRTLESFYRDYCRFPTVFFEAWKHQNDRNYLFSLILEMESLPLYKRYNFLKERLRQIGKLFWASTFGFADIVLRNLNTSLENVVKVMELVESKYFIYESAYKQNVKIFRETIEKLAKAGVSKKFVNEELREVWERIEEKFSNTDMEIRNLKPESRKLVLLIDDLDRLIPENAFKIIETLRFYFNVENVIIVMGINDKILENHVRKTYYLDADDLSENFLEKIFHHSFYLSASKINEIHLREFRDSSGRLNEKGKKLKEILERIDLILTHRNWVKVINRIAEEHTIHRQSDEFPNVKRVISALLLQLFPDFEYFNRKFPNKVEIENLAAAEKKGDSNFLSFEEREALKILKNDTTFVGYPKQTIKRILNVFLEFTETKGEQERV
jgi:hypothetical protein